MLSNKDDFYRDIIQQELNRMAKNRWIKQNV